MALSPKPTTVSSSSDQDSPNLIPGVTLMFSFYTISSFAIAAAISTSLLLSVPSVATAAEYAVAAPGVPAASIDAAKAQSSRREAKQIVKD